MKFVYCLVILIALLTSGCNQNMEEVNTGETLENSPRSAANPDSRPLAGAADEGEIEVPPFVKAYFMHTWVESLYMPPPNRNPNPNWESPLIDPVNGRVWCTDCHVNTDIDFSRIPKMRTPQVEQLENNKAFMAGLMKKWVQRLNSDQYLAKKKLKGPVTCLTCHATNPETSR
jgi:hypothetical protein